MKKNLFRKTVGKLHLWLGLMSGLVVFILGLTGCLLAFEIEIRNITEPQRFTKKEDKAVVMPSSVKAEAEKFLEGKELRSMEYQPEGQSIIAYYYDEHDYKQVFIHPYTGKMIAVKNMNHDFFRIVLDGHFYLWLPQGIGKPVIASATLIFVVMMISGLILWWPKRKHERKQRFTIRWQSKWRRKNYDLHNVLGFYMSWIAIFIAITGLVWGFTWFEKSFYWVTSGGREMLEEVHPHSDTTLDAKPVAAMDKIFSEMWRKKKNDEVLGIYLPLTHTDPLEAGINHRPGTYYDMDFYHFDQYTGKELPAEGTYAGSFKDAKFADKLKRMNYDLHTGAVLSIPGKLMAFFASLIAASLPVTGFLIWWGRRKKIQR